MHQFMVGVAGDINDHDEDEETETNVTFGEDLNSYIARE